MSVNVKQEIVVSAPIPDSGTPIISGDAASRRRQYWFAAAIGALIALMGHVLFMESTLGVYLLLESLITMLAFITGLFALIRYYSNRGTLYLYAGLGFLAAGWLDLIRLLMFTTGFAVTYNAWSIDYNQYLLWAGTLNHLFLALVMVAAMWDTRGLQHTLVRDSRSVALYVGILGAFCALGILFAPVPPPIPWLGILRPLELVPGALWVVSCVLLYRKGAWRTDTFVHWLVMALIIAASAALLLYPHVTSLTDSRSFIAQIIKLFAFALVLVGLGNSMFELVRRVESSMLAVQQLNDSLQKEINERRQAERALRASEADLAEAQQIARLGSWTWDIATDQYFGSDELMQIFGEPPGQGPLSFARMSALIHPEDMTRVRAAINEAVANRQELETYCRMVRRDGETRVLLIRGRPGVDENGELVRYRGTGQDLTEVVQTEQRLRETAEQLAASNRDLEEFAYIASHDLREPLRKIFSFSDRVINRYSDVLDENGRDYLDRVRQSALRMQALIDDVLALSRVNIRTDPFVHVALDRIVDEVLEDLEAYIDELHAQVTVEALPIVQGDPVQMRQLFQNLLTNALKFCRPDHAPTVTVTTAQSYVLLHGAPFCTVMVADEGIGFETRYAERIFQPFHRLHSRARYEGTGMGLSICRRIVERHGGQIRAESEPGRGSRFYVTLPLEQVVPEERARHEI